MSLRLAAALAALSVSAALPACSKQEASRIPNYPGSAQASAAPNVESPAGTLVRVHRITPDSVHKVAAFYRDELAGKLGFAETYTIGPTFGDGNLQVEGPPGDTASSAAPIDPSRPGARVVVYEYDNKTYVEIFQHVPKA